MSNQVTTIYAVNQGDDDRHCGYPAWFFTTRAAADDCAIDRGWYGGKAPVGEHTALIANGEAYLLASPKPIKLDVHPDDIIAKKRAVLAKLTKEEQELLGLK